MFTPLIAQSIMSVFVVVCSSVSAYFGALCFCSSMTLRNIKSSLGTLRADEVEMPSRKLEAKALSQMKKSSYEKLKSGKLEGVVKKIDKLFSKDKEVELAGLKNSINGYGLALARIQFATLGGGAFALVGCVFSIELMLTGSLLGFFLGFSYPSTFLKKRIERRSEELEKHLPEMLEILSIGMRSGLSFDRALEIYSANFDTALSREFANAQQLWMSGIKSRDCALRDITKGYDSMIFSRTIEALIRNLRLGTSVATSLLSASKEARANYQARREEAVRKAPIKMMIPTGTLILPAMLLLIMGPVLLELAGGGV